MKLSPSQRRDLNVRLTLRQQDSTRAKIRSTLLLQRLEAFALGEKINNRRVFMSAEQIAAARLCLAKALPDLQRTEHVGDGGGPVKHETVIPASADDAQRAYADMLTLDSGKAAAVH